jgi:UDPglucose 6-dehydrogenase
VNVHVLGDGLLAETVRACCLPHFEDVRPIDVLWVCYDTPVVDDVPDVEYVCREIGDNLPDRNTLILISSQLPVGTCALLEHRHPDHTFAVSPENIRRHRPTEDFLHQERVVIGAAFRDHRLEKLFAPFCPKIVWMSAESAEMVKHALNGYLAMCIAYGNELGDIIKQVGADIDDVMDGFLSDPRVAPTAPLKPGGPYTGGTLGRDVWVMSQLGDGPLIAAVNESNRRRL